MISEKISTQQEVAAFMATVRTTLLERGHKFDLLLRNGPQKGITYGLKELSLRDAAWSLANVPEISHYMAYATQQISAQAAAGATDRLLEMISQGSIGHGRHFDALSHYSRFAAFYQDNPVLVLCIFDGYSGGKGVARTQDLPISLLFIDRNRCPAHWENSLVTDVDSRILEFSLQAVKTRIQPLIDSKDLTLIGASYVESIGGNELISKVRRIFENEKDGEIRFSHYFSVDFMTPLFQKSSYIRTSLDGVYQELTPEVLKAMYDDYNERISVLGGVENDLLKLGPEYPWEIMLTVMSEGAFFGFEWERRGSPFQNVRFKHPVAKLSLGKKVLHKFILHWDGEHYRVEVTDMDADSELGLILASFGVSFENSAKTPKNSKNKNACPPKIDL